MKAQKSIQKVVSAVITVIPCLAAVICFTSIIGTLLHDDPSVFGFRCFFVMTGSMEPTLPTGSLVFTRKSPDGQYRTDDIITFISEDPSIEGSSNTHRIVEVRTEEGGVRYVTKGDANSVADACTVPPENIQGRVVFHTGKMTWVGKAVNFIMAPQGFLLVIVIPLVLIIASAMREYIQTYKEELEKLRKGVQTPPGEDSNPDNADEGKK